MFNYIEVKDKIKNWVAKDNFDKLPEIQKYIVESNSLNFDFYYEILSGKVSWFETLDTANVFDVNGFRLSDGIEMSPDWNQFFYLLSVWDKKTSRVNDIFRLMLEKNCQNPTYFHLYIRTIIMGLTDNKYLTIEQIKYVLEPIIDIQPSGGLGMSPDLWVKLAEKLIYQDTVWGIDFVAMLIKASVVKNKRKRFDSDEEYDVYELCSWNKEDYSRFIEKLSTDEFKEYSFPILEKIFSNLRKLYCEYPELEICKHKDIDDLLKNAKHYYRDIGSLLVSYVAYLIENLNKKNLADFYKMLEDCSAKDNFIKKLLFYTVRKHDDVAKTREILLNPEYLQFVCTGFVNFNKMVVANFEKIDEDSRNKILINIEAIYNKDVKAHKIPENETAGHIKSFFGLFANGLTEEFKNKYGSHLKSFDAKKLLAEKAYESESFMVGGQSEFSYDELKDKSFEEIVEQIKKFKPSSCHFGDIPSYEGTAKVVAKVVLERKSDYLDHISLFMDTRINPEYALAVIAGDNLITDELSKRNMESLISYLKWLSEQPFEYSQEFSDAGAIGRSNCYELWKYVADRVADITFKDKLIDEVSAIDLYKILDKNLSQVDAWASKDDPREDYMSTAINSLLGKSVEALIRLGFYANRAKNSELKEKITAKLLEIIKSKNKPAYAILGRYSPWLHNIIANEEIQIYDLVFPENDVDLFKASFNGYLYNAVYVDFFKKIRKKYLYAISEAYKNDEACNKERLGEYLGVFYFQGEIKNDDELGVALFSDNFLLAKAMWWIITYPNNRREENALTDNEVQRVKDCLNEYMEYVKANDLYKEQSRTLFMLSHIYANEQFNKFGDWALRIITEMSENGVDYSPYVDKFYQRLGLDIESYPELAIRFLHNYLCRKDSLDKNSIRQYRIPYVLESEKINVIFDKIVGSFKNYSSKEQELIKEIFNFICFAGYSGQVEKYVRKINLR